MDFVCTLRQSSSTKQSVFQWPNESFSYNSLVNIALHYLPPGCGFTIENKAPLPDWAWSEYTQGALHEETKIFYHGTAPEFLPSIFATGLRPTLGAGGHYLMAQYDTAVPGVYVGVTFTTASQYPMAVTAANGWSGGQLIAPDGTYPMRAVLRIIARNHKKL